MIESMLYVYDHLAIEQVLLSKVTYTDFRYIAGYGIWQVDWTLRIKPRTFWLTKSKTPIPQTIEGIF